jgi:serine/threonine protein kinase
MNKSIQKFKIPSRYEKIDGNSLHGGNGEVYKCKDTKTDSIVALKHLVRKSYEKEKKVRFLREIKVVKEQLKDIEGIIPILDSCCKEEWYTMPFAEGINDHNTASKANYIDIAEGIKQLAETLDVIHTKYKHSHRDIKPANIFFYNNKYSLGDFGLVDMPDEKKKNITKVKSHIGAIFTMAPEMKRYADKADGKKADVYSLAKTFWMLLMNNDKGFEGPYDFLKRDQGLQFNDELKNIHLAEIHILLNDATQNDPDARPSMRKFSKSIDSWLNILNKKEDCQTSDWNFLNNCLFKDTKPHSACWTNIDDILHVLNTIKSVPAMNHMMLERGGLDFDFAEKAPETDWIYIVANRLRLLVCPACLHFESFEDVMWNYFLLELKDSEPILNKKNEWCEELIEDTPAHYVDDTDAVYGVYSYDEGKRFPSGYKIVTRYIKGKFLIVLKYGHYNGIGSAYDGRQKDCSAVEFRNYMDNMVETVKRKLDQGFSMECIMAEFNQNPFKPDVIKFGESETKNPEIFIKENLGNWDFSDIIANAIQNKESKIKYSIEFKHSSVSLLEGFNGRCLYLSTDGKIVLGNKSDKSKFYVYGISNAISFRNAIYKKIDVLCSAYDHSMVRLELGIHFISERIGKPSHLFTLEEVKLCMKDADDRTINSLVIDDDGCVKMIQTDYRDAYPVSQEKFGARNNYVGKYSKLSSAEDYYQGALEGWLYYLKNKTSIYIDVNNSEFTPEQLVEKINEFY